MSLAICGRTWIDPLLFGKMKTKTYCNIRTCSLSETKIDVIMSARMDIATSPNDINIYRLLTMFRYYVGAEKRHTQGRARSWAAKQPLSSPGNCPLVHIISSVQIYSFIIACSSGPSVFSMNSISLHCVPMSPFPSAASYHPIPALDLKHQKTSFKG